jgi:ABC-type transport system involved in multi-copper enzyme maturation permease subunit
MLWLIARKEFQHNLQSRRTLVAYALFLTLSLFSTFLMAQNYTARHRQFVTEERKERQRLAALSDIESPIQQWRDYMSYPLMGVREPLAISVIARGMEPDLPVRFSSLAYYSSPVHRRGESNYLLQMFQSFDLVYVVLVIGSLLALLLSYDAVSEERERGTLQLLLAHAVPRDTVLRGKWLGGYSSLILPFVIAIALVLAFLLHTGAVRLSANDIVAILIIFFLSLLYLAAVFNLGILASTLAHRSATSLASVLLVWVVVVLVVPNGVPSVVQVLQPVASRQQVLQEREAIRREDVRRTGHSGGPKFAEGAGELESDHRVRLREQLQASQAWSRVSPAACYLFAVTRVAGTGLRLHTDFLDAQERFRLQKVSYSRQQREAIGQIQAGEAWFHPEEVPRFHLVREDLAESIRGVWVDFLLLVLANVVLFLGAHVSFLRRQPY